MELLHIFEKIKKEFCGLTQAKLRDNVLEIVTPFSTLNNKFVSVFLKQHNGRFIVTDGGWIHEKYYETPEYEESEELINRISNYYLVYYKIKVTQDRSEIQYYYKSCIDIIDIPSLIFDLSNFIVGVVNAFCIQLKDEKEEKERETFRKEANDFLKAHFSNNVKFIKSLDDFKTIRFNAIIARSSSIYLITYITGSTPYYFDNDLRRTIVNYEISERSRYNAFIKERLSLINNEAPGYHPDKSASLIGLLSEKTSKEPIKWTEKEKLLQYI